MCVTFVYVNADDAVGDRSKLQLVVLNNRDENFDRPTSLAAWEGDILAGRDEAIPNCRGGTWLGIHRNGKVGVLLSMLEKDSSVIPSAPTRGRIVNDFLGSKISAVDYGNILSKSAHQYNGFNTLLLDRVRNSEGRLSYRLVNFINKQDCPTPECLGSGVYGFGNSLRETPFKKVSFGSKLFQKAIHEVDGQGREQLIQSFISILRDSTNHHPDEQLLSQTDQPEECSRMMSQLFYRFPPPHRYGTRSHTIIMVDGVGGVFYYELSQVPPSADYRDTQWVVTTHEFCIEDEQ